MSYQVIKHFGEYQPGAVLADEQFINQRRIALLVEQRYIQPAMEEPETTSEETTERVAMVVPRSATIKRGGKRR